MFAHVVLSQLHQTFLGRTADLAAGWERAADGGHAAWLQASATLIAMNNYSAALGSCTTLRPGG
jgi:hypothetical protein